VGTLDRFTYLLTYLLFYLLFICLRVRCTAEGRGRSWVEDRPGRLCSRAGCARRPWERCL